MSNIWSKNKYVEVVINLLIYLMSMNFLHYGQFLLPIICITIFIDRRLKFYVKDKKTFVVLCLFGISFFAFSYNLGLYSTMGLCLPMAYYIGSNIYIINENNIKKLVYIVMYGMVTHYLLNFIYEFSRFGWYKTITKATRYDIWLQDEFVPTGTATNAVIILSIAYYLLIYEKNIKEKLLNIVLLTLTIVYTVILRRRIQIAILIIFFAISMIIDYFVFKNKKNYQKLKYLLLLCILLTIAVLIFFYFDLFNLKRWITVNSIFAYVKNNGIKSGRLSILLEGINYIPTYLFGGKNISNIIGMPFHDFILDIYDYAGIVPTLIMLCFVVICLKNLYKFAKTKSMSNSIKLMILEIAFGYIIMCFLEPLMTGSSTFVIVGILIEASVELLS